MRIAEPTALHIHANAEQIPLSVVQRGEVHSLRQRAHPPRQRAVLAFRH